MVKKEIKAFEEQLLIAINAYLIKKEFLQDGNGTKYYCEKTSASGLYLKLLEHHEDILLTFLDCTTNTPPCLSGYIDLALKEDGCDIFKTERYYFHICASDYEVRSTNPLEIEVRDMPLFYKQNSRLF